MSDCNQLSYFLGVIYPMYRTCIRNIEVICLFTVDEKRKLMFYCYRSFLTCGLFCTVEAPESGPVETDYIITTYTGKKAGAGTNANVIVTITGEEGESGPHKLDKKGDNFEKGQYVLYSSFYHNNNIYNNNN